MKELSADFHAYYNAERVLVDDDEHAQRPVGAAACHAAGAGERTRITRRFSAATHVNETENVPDTSQRGTTLVGFIAGLVLGLAIAVAVALFITNAPVPFVNKVRPASENVNPAGSGPLPDPNKPLYSHAPPKAAAPEPPKIESGDRSEGRTAAGRKRQRFSGRRLALFVAGGRFQDAR